MMKEKKESGTEEEKPTVEMLETELAQLRGAFSRQEEDAKGYMEQIKRLQADFENWRKRVEAEKLFLVENASAAFIEKLLPVLDNFERALATDEKFADHNTLREGMNLIHRQFLDLLREAGVATVETIGKQFDPNVHEAYAYEEREAGEDHQVIEEGRKGYIFKGKLLRPALVKVLLRSKQDEPLESKQIGG